MIRRILVLGALTMTVVLAQSQGQSEYKYNADADPNYKAPKTSWGEPDLRGMWPLNHLIAVGLQRNERYGNRLYLTDEELDQAQNRLDQRNSRFEGAEIPVADTSSRVMRQTSLIVSPANGQFPELTPYGKDMSAKMRSSYKPGQVVFDKVEDFSAWDRCITRGMPASMEPRNYNNGLRIFQSPGYVAIVLEMAHETRIIPTDGRAQLDDGIKQWLGESRGHWEGNTLVVETTNYNGKVGKTSAGVPGSPRPLQPSTPNMRTVERFTRVADDQINYEITIEDPEVLTEPFTVAYPMYLDNDYQMYEYACHEGNTAVRNYIEASRFERKEAAAKGEEIKDKF